MNTITGLYNISFDNQKRASEISGQIRMIEASLKASSLDCNYRYIISDMESLLWDCRKKRLFFVLGKLHTPLIETKMCIRLSLGDKNYLPDFASKITRLIKKNSSKGFGNEAVSA